MITSAGTDNGASHLESIFHATQLELLLPNASSISRQVGDGNAAAAARRAGGQSSPLEPVTALDLDTLRRSVTREVAFFDERLTYFLALHVPHDVLTGASGSGSGTPPDLAQFLAHLQLTLTASFLPPLDLSGSATPRLSQGHPGSNDALYVPETPISHSTPTGVADPATPMPFPVMRDNEKSYAHVDGITVWEGDVSMLPATPGTGTGAGKGNAQSSGEEQGKSRKTIHRTECGWDIIYEAQVPIAYVRTPIPDPLLGLTASITLRDQPARRRTGQSHRSTFSVDTINSIDAPETEPGSPAAETVDRIEGGAGVHGGEDGEGLDGMFEVDLLGGLGGPGATLPPTRLGPSTTADLSYPPSSPLSALPLSALTPTSAPPIPSPQSSLASAFQARRNPANPPTSFQATVSTTLRKSYRRVLGLSPGLRVRMRNLVLPQLVAAKREAGIDRLRDAEGEGEEGEKQVVLCIEIENPPEDTEHAWIISGVGVDIGGKGGKASASLSCDPEDVPFPLRLDPVEQYNLLYAVNIASGTGDSLDGSGVGGGGAVDAQAQAVLRNLGTAELQRPVAITVHAYPVVRASGKTGAEADKSNTIQPTEEFTSRWNCTLDLAAYYAWQVAGGGLGGGNRQSITSSAGQYGALDKRRPGQGRGGRDSRLATPGAPLALNQIAGDKRYSLASLLQGDTADPNGGRSGGNRVVSKPRPLMPSQLINQAAYANGSGQGSGQAYAPQGNEGLLISAKLLPVPSSSGSAPGITDSDHGSTTGSTIRPLDEFTVEIFVQNLTEEVRRFRLSFPASSGANNHPSRSSQVASHNMSSDSPALLPLENDVRCGPLLPGASLAARIRFIALKEGVHRVEKLRVTGVGPGDGLDHIVSPLLDVVVSPRS